MADVERSIAAVKALHERVPIYAYADDCECEDKESDAHETMDDENGDPLCLASATGEAFCGHCSHEEDYERTDYPCPTLQALPPDPAEALTWDALKKWREGIDWDEREQRRKEDRCLHGETDDQGRHVGTVYEVEYTRILQETFGLGPFEVGNLVTTLSMFTYPHWASKMGLDETCCCGVEGCDGTGPWPGEVEETDDE